MDQRNTLYAVLLSLVILLGWEFFLSPIFMPPKPPVTQTATPLEAPTAAPGAAPSAPGTTPVAVPPDAATPTVSAEPARAPEKRVRIATPHVHGSISLTGARFDDITLAHYHETLDKTSPEIVLLAPQSSPKPYYSEWGWITGDTNMALPGPTTEWTQVGDNTLTDTTPLVLTWDNGQGLTFTRTIKADREYLFTIEQTVNNAGERPVTFYPYALVARLDQHTSKQLAFIHEGPLGVFERTLKEESYEDLKDSGRETAESVGGWIGITDKYWLTAVAFDPAMKIAGSYNYADAAGRERYQTDLRGDAITVQPGENKVVTGYVFAGAKELQLLDEYASNPGIPRFDLAIDFGWYYFLTKPFFLAIRWLNGVLGNFGLAIIAFSTLVRLLMFPIANKQYKAMNNLRRLQPQMKSLQERYANDRVKLQQEMMDLYKRENANPLTGCLPILIQIPVFYALYKVLSVTIEMRHAPFYGWIHDLSAQDPTSILNLFGLLPYSIPSYLSLVSIGVWPLIMGITMWFQQKLSPQPTDPVQAKVMMLLPIIITFMLAPQPAGLVIYWAWSNLLGILQQWILLRQAEPTPAKAA